jgi:hypothetical protein
MTSSGKILSALTALVSVAAVSTAIWLNPPSGYRAATLDAVRMKGLNDIERAVKTYFKKNEVLPLDLAMLSKEKNDLQWDDWHDPETKLPYEYQILGEKYYKLCANFARSWETNTVYHRYPYTKHNAGHDCIEHRIETPTTRSSLTDAEKRALQQLKAEGHSLSGKDKIKP